MNSSGWIQLILYVGILLAITKPLGLYLCKVLDVDGKTFLDPVFKPLERLGRDGWRRMDAPESEPATIDRPLPARSPRRILVDA